MTREQAIESLSWLKTRLSVGLGGMDKLSPHYKDMVDEVQSIALAIAALRGPQPDPITGLMPCGCEWCMAEKRIMEHHGLSFNAYCVIFDGKLDVSYDNNDINEWVCGHKEVKINYCPMCGRKLEGRQ